MPKKETRVDYIKMIREAPSKTINYVFIGMTFVVSALLIAFAVRPTVMTILDINKEIKEKERVSELLSKKIDSLSTLDTQYNENKEKFESLSLIYPTSGNFSLFLSNIEAVVSKDNFVLNSVSFDEYDEEDFGISTSVLQPWSARLSVSGKKSDVINLLKDLEAMPMYPVIERFSYSSKVDEAGNIGYSLTLRIYHIENNLFYE